MGGCVGSALLSSLIAWSSANRMAVMGESLLSNGICPKNCSALALSRITCPDVYYRACCMLRLTNDGYGNLNSALTMCCFQLRLKLLGYFISIALVFKGFGARLQNSQLNIKFFSVLTLKRHNTRDQRSPRCCFVGHEHVFS